MATSKNKSKKNPQAQVTQPVDDAVEDVAFVTTTLTTADQTFLARTQRFLINIVSPGFADRARREGYNSVEHALGWQLWRTSAGETRPFEHWLTEEQVADGISKDNEEQRDLLQQIDTFENTWLPRTRAIIRRVVPKPRRDAFAAAFFKDLSQQPLGPTVVGSVSTFVTRVEGLDKSDDPDAKRVRAMLFARGLNTNKLAQVKTLLKAAKQGIDSSRRSEPAVSAEELADAQTAQLEALEQLRDWFNDWGTTLRTSFGPADQIRLGLTVPKPSRSVVVDEPVGSRTEAPTDDQPAGDEGNEEV